MEGENEMTYLRTSALRRVRRIARQRGLTLVELMVALVVGLMVIMAAMSVFSSSSQSARTVDTAGQLRDDVRFATDIIQRLAVQTGFEDIAFVTRAYFGTPQTYKGANGHDPREMTPPIQGFHLETVTGGSSDNISTETKTGGKSDVLVLRYQAVNKGNTAGTEADGSMMVCSGDTLQGTDGAHGLNERTERAVSIFYVDTDTDNESNLYCRFSTKGGALSDPIPLVKGVESFRVLYGVDNISPGNAVDDNDNTKHAKLIPNRYVTADQMGVSNDVPGTYTNWRRVRSLRVGMVVRSAENHGTAKMSETIYPLGEEFSSLAAYPVDDNRLRQKHVFTVNIRNCLNQGYQAAGDPGKPEADDVPPCDVIVPRDGATS